MKLLFHIVDKGRRRLLWCAALIACLCLSAPVISAQSFYGSIVGAAQDPSGAVLPGVDVTLTNLGTNDRQTAQTDQNGSYRFLNLVPGRYSLSFEKTGFERLVRNNIEVDVEAAVRIDAALTLGQVTQTVDITSQTPLLDTENATVSQVVESQVVQDTPINGRNVDNLISIAPGVIPQTGTVAPTTQQMNGGTATGEGNSSAYSIGGGAANQNALTLNGTTINRPDGDQVALVPTQDAIQQFRVDTSNLPPDSGRTAGGAVNETTKSGANAYHGAVYDYFRNTALDANAFFNNRLGIKRGEFNQNQYGLNLGGPVMKDKLFFFIAGEITDNRVGGPSLFTVPTVAERNGDFSQAGLGNIYDPLTVCGNYGNAPCATVNGQPVYTRQQFSCNGVLNVICPNRLDPAAKFLENYFPLPQTTAITNNFATNQKIENNQQQENARLDYTLSQKQNLFGQFTYWHTSVSAGDPYGKQLIGQPFMWSTMDIVLGDTYVFSPTTVGDLRVGYLRNNNPGVATQINKPFAQVSLFGPGWASEANEFQNQSYPQMSINSQGIGPAFGPGSTADKGNTYSLAASVTKILGKHSLKFGGEARRLEWYNWAQGTAGSTSFDTTFTQFNPLQGNGTGNAFAAFLLGFPTTGSTNWTINASQYEYYNAIFAQDSYKATNKLTVNYGVRWDISPGEWEEKHGNAAVFNPTETDPLTSQISSSYITHPLTGQVDFVNSQQDPTSSIHPSKRDLISPRLGLTYLLTPHTVFRGGYAILFVPSNVLTTDAPTATSVTTGTTAMVTTLNAGVTPAAAYTLSGSTFTPITSYSAVGSQQTAGVLSVPYPTGLVHASGRNEAALRTAIEGGSITDPISNLSYPNMQQWNFGLENQSVKGILLAVAYVGSKGTHLPWTGGNPQADQLSDQYDSMGTALSQSVTNPFFGVLPLSAGKFATSPTITVGQLLRPFPQFQGVVTPGFYYGDSTYHSLQVRAEKRFGTTGVLGGSYTWLKLIDNYDSAPQDWTNLRPEKSLAAIDVPNRAVIRYVYTLPVGKGKKYFAGANGWEDRVISGFGIEGISTFQAGFPLEFTTTGSSLPGFGAGTIRPNFVPGCNFRVAGKPSARINEWFNTACVTQTANAFSFGDAPRNFGAVRSQGVDNWDMALSKKTPIREGMNFEFRWEAFNLFNHTQFNPPSTQYGNSFGVVTAAIGSQVNQPRLMQVAARINF